MATDFEAERRLLTNIKAKLPELESLLDQARSHWNYEDFVYRFYHQSFKVLGVQQMTLGMVKALRDLLPDAQVNPWFQSIIDEGTNRRFTDDTNATWLPSTRPMIEAFFHARFMLEMVVKYGAELSEPPQPMPSGWAAVLYLYGLR